MLNPKEFRLRVIRPTLLYLMPEVGYNLAAENLLLGTALVESRLEHLVQGGGGPARGVYQIEPATHADVWHSWIRYRPALLAKLRALHTPRSVATDCPAHEELETNLAYATAIARLIYRRSSMALPLADDADGLAAAHKKVYNTLAGATKVAESVVWFRRVVRGGDFAAPETER